MFYPLLVVLELFSISGLTNGYHINSKASVKSTEIYTGTQILSCDHTTVNGFDYVFEREEQNENVEEVGQDQLTSFALTFFHYLPNVESTKLSGLKANISTLSTRTHRLFILYHCLKIHI